MLRAVSARVPVLLRARSAAAAPLALRAVATYHELPDLPFTEETGAPTMSPKAFKHYREIMRSHLSRVNELLEAPIRAELRNLPLYALITRTARTPEHAHLFNFASQTWNMHYALACQTKEKKTPSEQVLRRINYEFMSLENLKREFINCAASMFGSGTVWLVEDEKLSLRIICCFNAGTPLAPGRLQLLDKNLLPETPSQDDVRDAALFQSMAVQGSDPAPEAAVSDAVQSATNKLEEARKDLLTTLDTLLEGRRKRDESSGAPSLTAPGGEDAASALSAERSTWPKAATQFDALMHRPPFGLPMVPILACNVWEHAYMFDYGTDRRKYLEDWWDHIDWDHVHHYMGADDWEPLGEGEDGKPYSVPSQPLPADEQPEAFRRFLESPQGRPATDVEVRPEMLLSGLKNRKARPSQAQLAADLAAALKIDIDKESK